MSIFKIFKIWLEKFNYYDDQTFIVIIVIFKKADTYLTIYIYILHLNKISTFLETQNILKLANI